MVCAQCGSLAGQTWSACKLCASKRKAPGRCKVCGTLKLIRETTGRAYCPAVQSHAERAAVNLPAHALQGFKRAPGSAPRPYPETLSEAQALARSAVDTTVYPYSGQRPGEPLDSFGIATRVSGRAPAEKPKRKRAERRIDILCGCGWGRLAIPISQRPDHCGQCGRGIPFRD
jgi:hypothetical protein